MRCKVFTGKRWHIAEKQAYDWLAMQKPQLQLHHSETSMRGPAIVKVWYDFSRGRSHHPVRGQLARTSARVSS